MVDVATARRIAGGLEYARDACDERRLVFEVGGKGFAWSYLERVHPKKPRVPRLDVLAIRCPIERKEMLIEAAPDRFFDDDHYRGYPALLVRLGAIQEDELLALLEDARLMVLAAKPKRRRRPA
jgi:hypothetical protein